MLTIDGSQGEGGGQVLRSSLGLSLITGRPFRIDNIRGRRKKPGLLRQHLTAVRAAVEISGGEVTGDELRSSALTFVPGTVRPGRYSFNIGSAGSTSLVLQTVLPALALADAPSTVVVSGGTHNPMAPTFDFLTRVLFPLVQRMGPTIEATLERPGYFPGGGGRVRFDITPVSTLRPLALMDRGEIRSRTVSATVARVPHEVGEKQVSAILRALEWDRNVGRVVSVDSPTGRGNVVSVEIESDHVTEIVTGFPDRSLPPKKLAKKVAAEVEDYVDAGVPVGEHLADQILLWIALAGQGSFRTVALTKHTTTHCDIIRRFLDVWVNTQDDGGVVEVRVGRR